MLLALFSTLLAAAVQATSPTSESKHSLRLVQLDPIERNHVQDFTLGSGQLLQIRTLAKEPPLFEIPGFLSAEECDHIKQLAVMKGLIRSTVKPDREDDDTQEEDSSQDLFQEIDANQDEVLDVHEVLETLDVEENTFLRSEDGLQMFHDVHLDPNGDGVLSLDEFANIDKLKMTEIKEWIKEHSRDERRLTRVSQQTWLSQDDHEDKILKDLRQRTTELTGLPYSIVEHSEQLQVVYYKPGGHFHAHYDSEEVRTDERCTHTIGLVPEEDDKNSNKSSRLCRFITILYYLDDTIEGGETAFPVADNATFSEEDLSLDSCDLSRHCYDANLYVKPEKGKAVMWYNHYINDTTGWLGPMNLYSLHGGCDVKKGTKWIANNWINVDDSDDKQILYMKEKDSLKLKMRSQKADTLQPVDGDLNPEVADFIDAVHRLKEIWTDYLQSPAGSDAVRKYFVGEPALQDILDSLDEYVVKNAAEIHARRSGIQDMHYNIIWSDKVDERNVNEKVVTVNQDLSDFIVTASSHGRQREETEISFAKGKSIRILTNPFVSQAGSGKAVEGKGQDSSFEKRVLDEL